MSEVPLCCKRQWALLLQKVSETREWERGGERGREREREGGRERARESLPLSPSPSCPLSLAFCAHHYISAVDM